MSGCSRSCLSPWCVNGIVLLDRRNHIWNSAKVKIPFKFLQHSMLLHYSSRYISAILQLGIVFMARNQSTGKVATGGRETKDCSLMCLWPGEIMVAQMSNSTAINHDGDGDSWPWFTYQLAKNRFDKKQSSSTADLTSTCCWPTSRATSTPSSL